MGELSYGIPKSDVLYEGIYEPGVAEIEYEPLLPVPSLYGRDVGIAYLCAFPCLKVIGEESIFPVVVDHHPYAITDFRLIIFCWFSTPLQVDFMDTFVYHIVTRGDRYELLLYS